MGYDSYGSEPSTSRYDMVEPDWVDFLPEVIRVIEVVQTDIADLDNVADTLADMAEHDSRKPLLRAGMIAIDSMIESLQDIRKTLDNI